MLPRVLASIRPLVSSKIRNSKPEIRNKSDGQNPKGNPNTLAIPRCFQRISDFGLRPSFGFRISVFGFPCRLLAGCILALLAPSCWCQTNWPDAFATMPVPPGTTRLEQTNCSNVLLSSFKKNAAVKALILMPGATDELYFFHRVHVALTNSALNLRDAIFALTNQTLIRATLRPPFLLLHSDEDPLEPLEVIENQRTADKIKAHKFMPYVISDDQDWEHVFVALESKLGILLEPPAKSTDSFHFFRHNFAAYDLNGWEALEVAALAGKTTFTVKSGLVVFAGDRRYRTLPVAPAGLMNNDHPR